MEQLSQLYFNLYQTSISQGNKENSLEYNIKALEVNKRLFGEANIHVSNNNFIQA